MITFGQEHLPVELPDGLLSDGEQSVWVASPTSGDPIRLMRVLGVVKNSVDTKLVLDDGHQYPNYCCHLTLEPAIVHAENIVKFHQEQIDRYEVMKKAIRGRIEELRRK